ncbi:hypothetical protein PV11_08405 [Exophiala sideris]|uniref:GPI inositol-deacylase n=1 Tax=Exophiala sideris TaxID=1016849 RepID=A0A0D1VXB9_9EURO|nr:hypothetical protein PV11_08405 [Exophiala sideris]
MEEDKRMDPSAQISASFSHVSEARQEDNGQPGTDLLSDGADAPFKSSTQPEAGNTFWPCDFLVKNLPNARIFTWGYDANITKAFDFASQSSISQNANQLLSDLANERAEPEQRTRPLIIVSHSLGGIVVWMLWERFRPQN